MRRAHIAEGLRAPLHEHVEAICAHLLRRACGELDHLTLRHLGDGWDILAYLRLLEGGVRDLGDEQVQAKALDLDVELSALELAKLQVCHALGQQLGREGCLAKGDARLLALHDCQQSQRAEDVAIRPRDGLRQRGLQLGHRRALAGARQALKNKTQPCCGALPSLATIMLVSSSADLPSTSIVVNGSTGGMAARTPLATAI